MWGRAVLLVSLTALLLLLTPPLALSKGRTKCLGLPEVTPKRYVSSGGATLELTLGASGRLTHRLVTQVFAIFLNEVLGYRDVSIRPASEEGPRSIYESLSTVYSKNLPEVPKDFMINLEVWLPPDLNTIHLAETNNVKECGNVAPPGRYGWFIPKNLSKVLDNLDEWTIFRNLQTAQIFSLNKKNKKLVQDYTLVRGDQNQPSNLTYYCEQKICSGGFFTPSWCIDKSCALLIAEHTADTEFVVEDILTQKLYVEVAWVGPNILRVASDLEAIYRSERGRSLVYLSQMPSPLTLRSEHVSVTFPPCDEYSNNTLSFNCHYSNIRLVKLAWYKLVSAARPAYEALQKMELTTSDYRELVGDYLRRSSAGGGGEEEGGGSQLWEVACDWLKRHEEGAAGGGGGGGWRQWEPSDDERNELYIGGIFPLSTNLTNSLTARGIAVSSYMAIQAVNKNDNVLRDYELKLLLDDGKCQPDEVMKIFIEYIRMNIHNKLVGILGPACSDTVEPLAGVSKHFRTMVISYSAEGSSFSRAKYPYFFRTIGENKQYKHVYLKLLKLLEWTRVASLTEDGTKYTEYLSHTQDLLQANGIAFVANRKFPQDWERDAMKQYLEELKMKNARIIIADVNDEVARAVMCEAYLNKMTAYSGWVWFLPHWLSKNWYRQSSGKWKIRCTADEMREAINGHFSLTHSYFAPDSEMMQENMTVGEWRKKYRAEIRARAATASEKGLFDESNYAGYAYDAVWVYAYALDRLMKMNESYLSSIHDENTTKVFVSLIQNTSFSGVSGDIKFSSGPSRFSNINIMQWIDEETHVVGTFYPNQSNLGQEYSTGNLRLNLNIIKWLNAGGEKPWDGTPEEETCVIQSFADSLGSTCQTAIVVANIIGFGCLLLVVLIAFFIVKHQYDKKVRITQRYMKHLGIDLISGSTIASLDKWEIARERVVINRKLGEGAFGFVYGGEAYFSDKGWVAVAVKTLKVGSTAEEKLDFLSEAEVMKRFEHKNIVQLLGVCTKAEPVYTIMEFMLYGDLKTFLLARRHLVNEKNSEESDEVSNRRLTAMALDVARALSYLAELKYVHRDVASRNCLVNVNKTVKLGDFGMTRPMSENDYYKFDRKGMLPVRWMSPESLALGVFTPASDVWSFGVLLYEIITFGSFPFQGMSNSQVLDYVKAGNTLTIPDGVKPQLEGLIRSCWNKEYKKRPPASEIVEFLANNPRLLTPCLDVPLSSVQMEDTGEITLSGDRNRRFSMVLRQRSLPHDIAEPLLSSPPPRFRVARGASLGEEPSDAFL